MKKTFGIALLTITVAFFAGCNGNKKGTESNTDSTKTVSPMQEKINEYAVVKLTADMSKLTENEKKMIGIFIDIAQIMDDLYWEQTIGNKDEFLNTIKDPDAKKFAMMQYGPWDRLGENKPFIDGYTEKPKGSNFYPKDMTEAEFKALKDPNKTSQYTVIRRNEDGSLKVVWYHEEWKEKIQKVSDLLKQAAGLAEDPGLKKYLELRSEAVLTDDYFASDMAWMDMKKNGIDFVVGPIENYEDELNGYKTAFEGAVLVKDKEWSEKLEKFLKELPELQKQLPVDAKYKKEKPGSNSDLNAYDIVYYAGHANCGGKTIAINLPNDEKVQLKKGSRRLQLKNAMQAKFDNILKPISDMLIDKDQRANIKFDAFFSNVMFHEVAHGLGIKNTITGKGNIREALKSQYSTWEEAKADVLGLFMVQKLIEKGELTGITVEDAYVTYMAGLIRSVRFGATEAHGQANMMCFNFFEDNGAFTRTAEGTYKVDFAKMKAAIDGWSAKVLKTEGDGDFEGAQKYAAEQGKIRPELQKDLDKLKSAKIPKDVVFEQGKQTLGL